MKKLQAQICAALMISSIALGGIPPLQTFATEAGGDISGHWAESVITQFHQKGFISGYGDDTFKPDASITRAEFISMLNKAFGLTQKGEVTFSDVSADAWYYDAVTTAVKAGYCAGYEDGTFKPNATITRAEAAVMIAKAKGLIANAQAADEFTDAAKFRNGRKVILALSTRLDS